jgi:hypothetical protein
MLFDRLVMISQLRSTPAALPPRCQPSLAIAPLASLDDVGDADIVAFGDLSRAAVIRQNPLAQVC